METRGTHTPGRPEAAGAPRSTDAGDIEPPADPPEEGGELGTRGAAPGRAAGAWFRVPTGPSPAGQRGPQTERPRDERQTRPPRQRSRSGRYSAPERRGRTGGPPSRPHRACQTNSRRPWALGAGQACVSLRAGPPGCRDETVMILPQVHLRKPCYDFYFL